MAWTLLGLLAASGAAAQSVLPGPPGPYVFDLRGVTMGVPQAFGFYPGIPPDTLVPARGFGIEAGGYLFLGRIGPARIGAGASVVQVRGTSAGDVAITARIVAPQVSFNFGTARGWSYLSGGVGVGQLRGHAPAGAGVEAASRGSGPILAVNAGGGARWFVAPRLAFSVDLRLHRVGARGPDGGAPGTPATVLGSASVGLSFK
jgi:hypothetical protein